MSRIFAESRKVHVISDKSGQPACVVWRGRKEAVRVCNHWRIEDEWWKEGISREYYKVITATNLILVLYYDRLQNAWYAEKIID